MAEWKPRLQLSILQGTDNPTTKNCQVQNGNRAEGGRPTLHPVRNQADRYPQLGAKEIEKVLSFVCIKLVTHAVHRQIHNMPGIRISWEQRGQLGNKSLHELLRGNTAKRKEVTKHCCLVIK